MDGAKDAEVERGEAVDLDRAEDDEQELVKLTTWMEPNMMKMNM